MEARPVAEAEVRPRVVVAVVLDQLPSDVLERYLPYFRPDGALRRLAQRGAFHHRVRYAHAGTYTAAGHASIYTGTTPSVHGVVANEVFSAERGEVSCVDDGEHLVHGREDAYAGPSLLRAETVADALRRAHGAEARIVSVSLKDRASVIPGGRRPDAVVFYEKGLARYTTSRYYGEAPPEWLTAFLEADPVDAHLGVWEPLDAPLYEELLGADAAPGEGGWAGFDAAFPHEAAATPSPGVAYRGTPWSTEHLLALTSAAIEALGVGTDEVPDLVEISISGTDYVGHAFGPASWEYFDNLVRVDRALGIFLDALERDHGPIAVLVTSDHGVAALPETLPAETRGGRIRPLEIVRAVDRAVRRRLGRGTWVAAYTQPFVYLTERARTSPRRDEVLAIAVDALRATEGVHGAWTVEQARALGGSADPIEALVAASIADDPPGDLFVVPAEHWFVDDEEPLDRGTSHGTPWLYDRDVPVLFAGPGVTHVESDEPLDQLRVARTIAALLGIDGPDRAPVEPLPGI